MSKPIQSMFEKRRSRLTNTRSERAMLRAFDAPEPAATSGRTSCLGSEDTITGWAGGGSFWGSLGDTGRPINSCLESEYKLWVLRALLSTFARVEAHAV